MTDEAHAQQLEAVYLAFRSLWRPAPALVLLSGDAPEASLRAAGGRIAGHAVMLVTAEAADAKQAVRSGWCDFMVSTLDEALRILKLAVRRGTATGVVLHAETAAVQEECVERGVQPELLDTPVRELCERGAVQVVWHQHLDSGEHWVHWRGSPAMADELARTDAAAAACIRARREEKRRWLERAPRELGRTGVWTRVLPMFSDEQSALLTACASEASAVALSPRLEQS